MRTAREFDVGPVVAAIGAVLLIVSLFLDWFGDVSAFTVFEVLDLLLAALAIGCLVAMAGQLGLELRPGIGAGTALPLAAVALVVVVSQLLNHPPAAIDLSPETGLWLALAGSALMVGGSILSVARVSVAVDVEQRERAGRRRGAAAAPAEARSAEPAVQDELYPEEERKEKGPLGADDPETRPLDREPPG